MPSSLKKLIGFITFGSFFFAVAYFSHMNTVFQYDTDEGLFLIRAFLHAHGFLLYKEIRMDDPPFLVLLLSTIIKHISSSVYFARLLILFFSTLLLGNLFRIIYRTQNSLSALFTIGLLILSPNYLRLSVSVMPGLPAIALAISSIFYLIPYQNTHQKRYLFFSGCLFALALQIKLFVFVLLPGVAIELILIESKKLKSDKIYAQFLSVILWWIVSFTLVYFFMSFILTSVDYSQLLQPYWKMRKPGILNDLRGFLTIKGWLLGQYDIVLLALGGLVFLKNHKRKFFILPLISFIFGAFILCIHSPVWYHHQLLLSVPLCWLASFGVYALFDKEIWLGRNLKSMLNRIKDGVGIVFLSGVLVLVIIRIPLRYAAMVQQMNAPSPQEYDHVLDLMKKYSGQTHLVVTDSPLFAYYAKLPVPPRLATVSWKLLAAKILTSKDMIDIIRKEKPELVLFARFPGLHKEIAPYLKDKYNLLYQEDNNSFVRLYILNIVHLETTTPQKP